MLFIINNYNIMANIDLRKLIQEEVRKIMSEMPGDGYIQERPLTPAEEKKKEELVKALKPKYGKTPKTYAIATAKAKELAEDDENLDLGSDFEPVEPLNRYSSQVIQPRNGINASNKYLAIIFKNDEVDDNKYFDSEDDAKTWCDDCCKLAESMEERMLAFPDKTRAPGRNKENLPYHSPVSKTIDEMDEDLEEGIEFTDEFDDDPALVGKQSELPDDLQKAIINKKKSKEVEEIRALPHPTKRVAGAHGKKNLPKHAPVTSNMEEERMLPHPSIRVADTHRHHTLPNHSPVTTATKHGKK